MGSIDKNLAGADLLDCRVNPPGSFEMCWVGGLILCWTLLLETCVCLVEFELVLVVDCCRDMCWWLCLSICG